ncbi:MAG: hypothetical protein HRT57_04500 [Crocinitomicaceae bacterium]|nr:hypothetical protein [Crocinitomicaceae bacterium]
MKFWSNNLPDEIQKKLAAGVDAFALVSNTATMSQIDMMTTTTDGDLLSSLIVFCPPTIDTCIVDSAFVIKIPIRNPYSCPLENIKFYSSAIQNGKNVWREENQLMEPEIIDGLQYISVTLTNICGCINLDYKLEMPCFPTKKTTLKVPNSRSDYFEIVLANTNTIYNVNTAKNSTIKLTISESKANHVFINARFEFYFKKYDLELIPLSSLPYSEKNKTYTLTKNMIRQLAKTI